METSSSRGSGDSSCRGVLICARRLATTWGSRPMSLLMLSGEDGRDQWYSPLTAVIWS